MKSSYRKQILSLVALIVFVFLATGSDDSPGDKSASKPDAANAEKNAPASQEQEKPVNLNDANSLDDKYGTSAVVMCASHADDYLRTVAKYDFKWDDIGFFDTKFDHIRLKVKSPGVLTLVTDKVKFQNGFGAFQHVILTCDYDTQAKQVMGYSVTEP